jgi:hypothetical protein
VRGAVCIDARKSNPTLMLRGKIGPSFLPQESEQLEDARPHIVSDGPPPPDDYALEDK